MDRLAEARERLEAELLPQATHPAAVAIAAAAAAGRAFQGTPNAGGARPAAAAAPHRELLGRARERMGPPDFEDLDVIDGRPLRAGPADPRLVGSAAAALERARERRRREAEDRQVAAKGKGKGDPDATGKGKGKGSSETPATPAVPVRFSAYKMDGSEVKVDVMSNSQVQAALQQVSDELGIVAGRLKLCANGVTLNPHASIADSGIENDSDVSIVILPPIYGHIANQRLLVPDQIISNKLELHEDLLQRRQQLRAPLTQAAHPAAAAIAAAAAAGRAFQAD
eukprot:SRR837773.16924.p1 GENE.SRR837773.16924~~SRR837773.16924.p1  ORF type:complete len:295 (-),score=62.33 SRR837773.16924:224-1072(-)